MKTLAIAIRNIFRQRRRYELMFVAMLVAISFIVVVNSVSAGAIRTLRMKAARYFSGHVSIMGYDWGWSLIPRPDLLIEDIKGANLPIRTVSARTMYLDDGASLILSGKTIRQRRLVGVDFALESEEFSTLNLLQGSIEPVDQLPEDAILISEDAARLLNARVGDRLTLSLRTYSGQYNTGSLEVRGVFEETSLFGFAAYLERKVLNRLIAREQDSATDIALFIEDGIDEKRLSKQLASLLDDDYRILPLIESSEQLSQSLAEADWTRGAVLAIAGLEVHLDKISMIVDSLLVVTWFVLAVFLCLVMFGILNTYRLLVFEKTREIGTMRAMGMSRWHVQALFFTEATVLATLSSLTGMLTSTFLSSMIGTASVRALPGSALYTDGGRLRPIVQPSVFLVSFMLMVIIANIAVASPAIKASKIDPAEALRS